MISGIVPTNFVLTSQGASLTALELHPLGISVGYFLQYVASFFFNVFYGHFYSSSICERF